MSINISEWSTANRLRLCVVGPMVARHSGRVTTQGEILANHFQAAGHRVICVSRSANRYLRLVDVAVTMVRSFSSVDIALIQVFGGPSFVVEDMASALARLFGHRIVMHLHGGAMPEFIARFPRWTRRVLDRAHRIVVPSRYLARTLDACGRRARVIPNSIDLSDYGFRQREHVGPRLLWMRSFHPIYNPLMALRVLARVRARWSDATLTMAGENKGFEQKVRREAEKLGVREAVRFAGFLNTARKRVEGGHADIFLNTSHIDNAPVAIVEAWAMGLPIVTTSVGGIRDMLTHGVSGLLVPDDDDEAMADAVLALIDHPSLAARLSSAGRTLAEEASWEKTRHQWDALFAELATLPRHMSARQSV